MMAVRVRDGGTTGYSDRYDRYDHTGYALRGQPFAMLMLCFLLGVFFYLVQFHLWGSTRIYLIQNNVPSTSHDNGDLKTELSPCTEVSHVVVIKVPKAASGTITSIVKNFGLARNLTFALPKTGTHFGMGPLTKEKILPVSKGDHYDLLVQHSTYNRDVIHEVFPKDTKIIASVREPMDHFISAFYYLEDFTSDVPENLKNSPYQIKWFISNFYERNHKPGLRGRLNIQSRRFGMELRQALNATYVQEYIHTVLDKDIDFVLIQEYFDESLVLLKRRFCWKLSDIIYRSYHVNHKSRDDHVHTDQLLKQHKQLALAEYLIYDHFYTKFWTAVWKEGPLFFEEVRVFKGILNRIETFCSGIPLNIHKLTLPSTRWNTEFTLTGDLCRDMRSGLAEFVADQKQKQAVDVPLGQV